MSLLLKSLSIIAPARCLVCGREGVDLCPVCALELASPLPARCWRCQKLSLGSKTCSTCRRYAPLNFVWVAGEYESGLKSAIHGFKFNRQRGLAHPLAALLYDKLPVYKNPPLVVHIPTATIRRRARGYDQAELLASALGKIAGWRHVPLIRRQGQVRQVGAKRQTRLAQLEGAFRIIRPEYVREREILLVDDVITTGATAAVCAKELKTTGAKSVSAVVLAQKS